MRQRMKDKILLHREWRKNNRGDYAHFADHHNGNGETVDVLIYRRRLGIARLIHGKYEVETLAPLAPAKANARTLRKAWDAAMGFVFSDLAKRMSWSITPSF